MTLEISFMMIQVGKTFVAKIVFKLKQNFKKKKIDEKTSCDAKSAIKKTLSIRVAGYYTKIA